ncbi:MAG: antibiotic biosynthesis monooxygenase [Phycisphaerae bacterium]
MGDVHVAITRTVLPGAEEQFHEKLLQFVRRSMSAEGVTGVHILRPPPGSASREFGILRSFRDEAAAEAFYATELFAEWQREVEPLVAGNYTRRRLTGLEAFFRHGRGAMPPRWKMAIVTFLGVLPAVLFWTTILSPHLSATHWLARSALIIAAVVITLTWGLMPILTRLFHGWLHARSTG